jgi:hypothetical protein
MEVPAIAAIIAKMEEKMRNMVVFSFVRVGQNLYYVLWQKRQQIKKYDDLIDGKDQCCSFVKKLELINQDGTLKSKIRTFCEVFL